MYWADVTVTSAFEVSSLVRTICTEPEVLLKKNSTTVSCIVILRVLRTNQLLQLITAAMRPLNDELPVTIRKWQQHGRGRNGQ